MAKKKRATKRPTKLQLALARRAKTVLRQLQKAGKVDSLGHDMRATDQAVTPAPRTYGQLDVNTIAQQAADRAVHEDRVTQFLLFERNMPPGTQIVFGTVDQIRSIAKALRSRPFHL